MNNYKLILCIILGLLLISCGSSEQSYTERTPVTFEKSDECHVCGMAIARFSGPKGQIFETGNKQVRKFCSTMELLFWYLQPENRPNVTDLYVHDMAQAPWDKPDDNHLIAAKDAIYVIGSKMQGSMGPTLASFSSIISAEEFAKKQGGKIISFNDLTLKLLSKR